MSRVAALFEGARVTIPISKGESLQSDARFVDVLARMGADVQERDGETTVTGGAGLVGIDTDLSDMPDAAMTLGAVACFAKGRTTIRGLRTLRVKETDRLAAMVTELTKVGARVEIFEDAGDEGLTIDPPESLQHGSVKAVGEVGGVVFETYDDHRMAMSLALIGLRRPGVRIADPGCVAKTYPGFWADLRSIRGL